MATRLWRHFTRKSGPWSTPPAKDYLTNEVIEGRLAEGDKEAARGLAARVVQTGKIAIEQSQIQETSTVGVCDIICAIV